MDRKKFFNSFGVSLAGFFLVKFAPLAFLKGKGNKKKVSVKINPLAVKRQKIGRKNA